METKTIGSAQRKALDLPMNDWMHALAEQYGRVRNKFPDDQLLILFDIDGTILDMRHMVLYVLLSFDRAHETSYFQGLQVEDIKVHENQVRRLLEDLHVSATAKEQVLTWYLENRWSTDAVLVSHRPYRGVMDVIRWFQIQPGTEVGLNTGRPDSLRADTLRSLNALGREYRVEFKSELLFMNSGCWEEDVPEAKTQGLRFFQQAGYRIIAVVDNEPKNIQAMVQADPDEETLFLHANTLFESQRTATPRTVHGNSYDITSLVSENDLPSHVQFAWHGVNDPTNLRQFLASTIEWGECDVRCDPHNRIVLRHDSFTENPWTLGEEFLTLQETVAAFKHHSRGIKLDLKEGGELIHRVLALLADTGLADSQLWFNGNIESLRTEGFRAIEAVHPDAIIQCPVDFVAPLIFGAPKKAKEVLDMLTAWGINRFSISWKTQEKRQIFDCLDQWGFGINFYDVPDLEAFLQAALLLPKSLTSDFNFPQWQYFGRGSGQNGQHHHYQLMPTATPRRSVPIT